MAPSIGRTNGGVGGGSPPPPRPDSPFFKPNPRISIREGVAGDDDDNNNHNNNHNNNNHNNHRYRQSIISVKKRYGENAKDIPLEKFEKKSSLLGAYANLCTVTIGAGIIGLPYAVKESGLVAGTVMIVGCAILTDYSLRSIISAGKLVNVNSYETLTEAAFGRAGFLFVSLNMFFLSYGSMVAYLQIIRDTLPILFGADQHDLNTKRLIMFVVTLLVIVPLSSQRDMANLEKTSSLNVLLNVGLVALVVGYSPITDSVDARGGILQMMADEPFLDLRTFFVGFGVCSFAFVCHDSSFIIAGSMKTPSKQRWKRVTNGAMITCGVLELTLGIAGYLAYQGDTEGNVLNNMDVNHWSGLVSRAILSTTMFFAYPMNLYIVRHVFIVLFFKGAMAHEGGDSIMLARRDRRVILTVALYVLSLVPALLMQSTGRVLAVTGAIAGSSLAYIAPGMVTVGVHSDVLIELVHERWSNSSNYLWGYPEKVGEVEVGGSDGNSSKHLDISEDRQEQDITTSSNTTSKMDVLMWYLFLMPIWSLIALVGKKKLADHFKKEEMSSPSVVKPNRITLVGPMRVSTTAVGNKSASAAANGSTEQTALLHPMMESMDNQKGTLLNRSNSITDYEAELELKHEIPTWMDFIIAFFYIGLGVVAMVAGLISILFM